jgi:hypothetical protein
MSVKSANRNPWYARFYVLLFIWVGAGIFTGWKQYSLSEVNSHINNFQIFRASFGHFVQGMHLYPLYPREYFDLYLYGPAFAILMAPFAYLPLGWSVVVWNALNAGMLFWAVWNLPLVQKQRAWILWIILNSTITALLNTQFHALCVAMILWSYILMQRGKLGWSALLIALGVFIKFYGIVGLAFFFFTKERFRYAAYLLFWFVVVFLFPFLFGGWDYTWQCYQEWMEVLSHKNTLNVDIRNLRTDVCVMGMFRRITGDGTLSNSWFLIPSLLLSAWVYFQPKKWFHVDFQLRLMALVLIYLMLASTGTESPTLIMAFPGVGLWFVLGEKSRGRWILFVITLLISSFSPTDLFPRFLREAYVNRYALMILPLFVVWLSLLWDLRKPLQED